MEIGRLGKTSQAQHMERTQADSNFIRVGIEFNNGLDANRF